MGSINREPVYSVDPDTGNMVATGTKRNIFKDILSAALIGASEGQAAHNANPWSGAVQGLVAGGAGALEYQQQQDELKRQRAAQQFERQRQVQADTQRAGHEADQEAYWNATIAHHNLESLRQAQNLWLSNEKELDGQITAKKSDLRFYLSHGGTLVDSVPDNGKSGNAQTLMAHFQDSDLFKGSDGRLYLHIGIPNRDGLEYRDGWRDEKSGQLVDPRDKAEHYIIQLPKDFNTKDAVLGSTLLHDGIIPDNMKQDIRPDASYNLSVKDRVVLSNQRMKQASDAQEKEVRRQQQEVSNYLQAERLRFSEIHTRLSQIPGQLKALEAEEADAKEGSNEQKIAQGKIATLKQERESLNKELADMPSRYEEFMADKHPHLKNHDVAHQSRAFKGEVPAGKMAVMDPNGNLGYIPIGQWETARKQGYRALDTSQAQLFGASEPAKQEEGEETESEESEAPESENEPQE
jgi:hypothetical protein